MEDHGDQKCDSNSADPNLPGCGGYSQRKIHPLYRTSNQTYGSRKPTVHEMQTTFKGTSRQFSEAMLPTGMYRNYGFNTALDRSAVTNSTETLNNRKDKQLFNQHMNRSNKQDGNKSCASK